MKVLAVVACKNCGIIPGLLGTVHNHDGTYCVPCWYMKVRGVVI